MTLSDTGRLDRTAEPDIALSMDEEAFSAFYDRTSRPVWAYLARITGDRHLADDLLQETYYRFLRAAASHESEAHRRHSLFQIATNLARDARRRSLLRPWFGRRLVDQQEVAGSSDVAGDAERRTDVGRAMARLKPRDRSLLWLAHVEGFSHREIGDAIGVKPDSVKLLLFRARRRLAALLACAPPHAADRRTR